MVSELYLSPGAYRKLCDLNGVLVKDGDLTANHILVLAQLMDHSLEVLIAGKLDKGTVKELIMLVHLT